MKYKSVLLTLLLTLSSIAFAQRECDVTGEYTYNAPSNITFEQAKINAEKLARIDALARTFNISINQIDLSVLGTLEGVEIDNFYTHSVSETRGEWIKDRKPTQYDITYEDGELVVKATVWGVAREVVGASTIVEARVLCNGIEPKFESNRFKDGDDLYLYFRTPEDGWLCVFLTDRYRGYVFCLLPYRNSPDGAVRVKHDKEYVFFKADKSQPNWNIVDEYVMTCDDISEFNEICVVFSPHKFSKPVGLDAHLADKPITLDAKALDNWLLKCQSKDKDMVVMKKLIEIRK